MRGLTDRQREIIRLVAEGHSNAEIAERLVVTVNTVRIHLKHIYNVLGVSSRTMLAAKAARGEIPGMAEGEPQERHPDPDKMLPEDRRTSDQNHP